MTISSLWDIVCITSSHITATVTIRVVVYTNVIPISESRAIGWVTTDSLIIVLHNWVFGLFVDRE
jgi:hypothetical protein